MGMQKSGYDGMEWVDALRAKQDIRDFNNSDVKEEDIAKTALRDTAHIVFNTPALEEPNEVKITREAKRIQDDRVSAEKMVAANEVRAKLANRDEPIDPVALKVLIREAAPDSVVEREITQKDWEGSTDIDFLNNVARAAIAKVAEQKSIEWQDKAMVPVLNTGFDPEKRGANITPSTSPEVSQDERIHVGLAANQNSLFDPGRLDELAKLPTAQDIRKNEAKERAKKRAQQKSEEISAVDITVGAKFRAKSTIFIIEKIENGYVETSAGGNRHYRDPIETVVDFLNSMGAEKIDKNRSPISMNEGAQIMRSASEEGDAFIQRVPQNSLSMLDDIGDASMSKEERVKQLQEIFESKIDDTGETIRKANKERRESIKRKRKDSSWEGNKTTSTADMTRRLMEHWIPEEESE